MFSYLKGADELCEGVVILICNLSTYTFFDAEDFVLEPSSWIESFEMSFERGGSKFVNKCMLKSYSEENIL